MIKLYFTFIWILLSSCNKNKEINEKDFILRHAENLILDLRGKTISCVENLQIKNSSEIIFNGNGHKKIINLISAECGKCYTYLEEWKLFIESDKNFFNDKLKLYFITTGVTNEYFEHVLKNYSYPFTILIDTNGEFLECNKFIINPRETFLLDEKNSIMMRGSPLKNEVIFEVYKILIER